jgi:endonuclease III
MATAGSIKASEKQAICKKLTTILKKRYGGTTPKVELPVMESLIYSACLENESYERAQAAYDRLLEVFHDWNEVRVSSIAELEGVFQGHTESDWRALRVRSVLQSVFEKNYVFEFESIRKKTQDLAARQLKKIPNITPFMCNWVMQHALDVHLVPLDDSMRNAAVWLGLLDREEKTATGAETLKVALRKADVPLFTALLKSLSIEPAVKSIIDKELTSTGDEFDPTTAIARLPELLVTADAPPKSAKKKTASRGAKTVAKKTTPKKSPQKTAAKKKRSAKKK